MRGRPRIALLLLALGATLSACAPAGTPAQRQVDLILRNGRLVTLDDQRPEAQALAARGGRIVAVGSNAEIDALAGPATRSIDLGGRLAVPGFIEAHGHFSGIGAAQRNIDLRGARSWDEVIALVVRGAERARPGEWILGWGWHQEKWETAVRPAVEGYPVHDALSRALPGHPVLLKHAAGSHAGLVNARAMELAGIDRNTPDPPGGKILRDEAGQPTGVLRETAYRLALRAYDEQMAQRTPQEIEAEEERRIELASAECLSNGITSFQDAGSDFNTVDRLRRLAEAGRIGVRLWVMLSEPNEALAERIDDYRIDRAADGHLTVRAIKRSLDGALGSHGAWLLAPYTDLPDTTGLQTIGLAELERTARIAADHGFQLGVHAIGDRANRETLDLYERVFADIGDGAPPRWRIEHAQHLHPDDIPRFARLGVIAAMQAVHCTSDGPWVPERLGDRRSEEGAYVWRRLLDSGAVIANGTDAPVEDLDPIANFHASVTRRTASGHRFYPGQSMTREEALRSYTIQAAYAAHEEEDKGSLTPGKYADVTVLSRDILAVREDEILEARVLYTIVGGEVRYEADPTE